ncbi:MAG: DUF924 family protein [Alphaproteobacteria bacterium]
MSTAPEEVLDYWFNEVGADNWFASSPERDQEITKRFLEDHERAAGGGMSAWEDTPTGMLSLMLLLDQFPRHMFRNTPRAFATDDAALELARTGIIKHFDDRIGTSYKLCFYLPFAHSENMGDQRLALFYIRERTKHPVWLGHAEHNYNTVLRFGHFPERNKILGRPSTAAEEEYLKQPLVEF